MLILMRQVGESLRIGDVVIKIIAIKKDKVKIGVTALDGVKVYDPSDFEFQELNIDGEGD